MRIATMEEAESTNLGFGPKMSSVHVVTTRVVPSCPAEPPPPEATRRMSSDKVSESLR